MLVFEWRFDEQKRETIKLSWSAVVVCFDCVWGSGKHSREKCENKRVRSPR